MLVPRLAYLGRPPWSWPVRRRQAPRPVPPCPSQSLPRRQSDAVQIYFPPSHHPLVFFLCNMSLPVHQPWGASPLTRRASSEEQKLTKQASQVLPPVLPDCSTDLASQNLQQPVVERNDEYRSPAPTPHLSRPRRRRRWATASPPLPPSPSSMAMPEPRVRVRLH